MINYTSMAVKKIILVWLGLCLAACSGRLPALPTQTAAATRAPSQTTRPAASATAQPSASPTPPARSLGLGPEAAHGQIIQLWHPWIGAEAEEFESLVEAFNLSNEWKIVVVAVAQAGLDGVQAQMQPALSAGGDPPDLAVGFLHQALQWQTARPLIDWNAYLQDPTWGWTASEQADFYPVFWNSETVAGKQIGLPVLRSAQVLYYNRTWAAELEFFTPPTQPQQFADQACASGEALRHDETPDNDALGGLIASNNYAAALGWIYAFGGQVQSMDSPPDTSPYRFNTPAAQEAFGFLRDLQDGQCAWLDETGSPEAAFASRQGLFAVGSVMGIPYQAQWMRQAGRGDDWTVIPFPSPTAGGSAIAAYGPSIYLLPSTPERQLASWLFVRWLLQPQQHARLARASGSFPVRQSELAELQSYRQQYPAYDAALALIPSAHSDPPEASWETVRWALSDAATQLFRPYFSVDQIPKMLEYLDTTTAALVLGPEASGVFHTPTPTSVPSATPTRTPWPTPQK